MLADADFGYNRVMDRQDYRFVTHWRVEGTCEQVYEILIEPEGYARWWGDCYKRIEHLRDNDTHGVGGASRIVNKGFLPYTLTWTSTLIKENPPHGFTIQASGELDGEGQWELKQDGDCVNIIFHWNVRLTKRWLQRLAIIVKPFLIVNHNYVMNLGQKHLQEEIQRRYHAK